jgi:phosphomannomutase
MDMFKQYSSKVIGDFNIQKIEWNTFGDCLEWHLNNKSWIKFRMSGTEPKFKIYYELNGDNLTTLNKQYEKLNNEFNALLH